MLNMSIAATVSWYFITVFVVYFCLCLISAIRHNCLVYTDKFLLAVVSLFWWAALIILTAMGLFNIVSFLAEWCARKIGE